MLLPVLFLAILWLPVTPKLKEKSPGSLAKIEFDEKLQSEADALLPLFDGMPPVTVYFAAEAIQKSGTSIETGVAYTQCQTPEKPVIYIKKEFYSRTNRRQLVNILKHELTHAWACRRNLMGGHDELFRRKFTAVGGFGN